MRYVKGQATDYNDLITQIIAWTTNQSIHGEETWKLMRNAPWPRGTILKAKGFNEGEHLYLGLLPNKIIKGETYKNWFFKPENLSTYFMWNRYGDNVKEGERTGTYYQFDGNTISYGPQDNLTKIEFASDVDIFEHSAQVMHLGVFKQYSDGLSWNEQGGGIEFSRKTPMMEIYYRQSKVDGLADYIPPLMPGVGYPTMSMDINGPIDGYFDYWLVKDAHSLIIVTQNREYWDSSYLGFLEPYDNKEYSFPAVVIGATSGLVMSGKDVIKFSNQQYPMAVFGLKVDYRPDNWSLSHGIVPFATAPGNYSACPTQAMVMLPDGQWRSFANYLQTLSAVNIHSCNGSTPGHVFMRNEPQHYNGKYFIRPTENEVLDFSHVYTVDKDRYLYKLEPIEFVENEENLTNMLGRVPYMYYPSHPVVRYGEITFNGKKHLVLPNCWEDRKFHYEGHAGVVYDINVDALLAKDKRMETLSKQMNLVIRLEE